MGFHMSFGLVAYYLVSSWMKEHWSNSRKVPNHIPTQVESITCPWNISIMLLESYHPSIKGTSSSSFMSITTKSTRNVNLSTLARTSSTTPYGYFVSWSTNFKVILVGLISKSPIFFNIAKDIRFILSPKSRKALSTDKAPKDTRRLKLLGTLDFLGKPFWIMKMYLSSSSIFFSSI